MDKIKKVSKKVFATREEKSWNVTSIVIDYLPRDLTRNELERKMIAKYHDSLGVQKMVNPEPSTGYQRAIVRFTSEKGAEKAVDAMTSFKHKINGHRVYAAFLREDAEGASPVVGN